MKAVCIPSHRTIGPFDDEMGEILVLDRPLRAVQRDALTAAGVELVGQPPNNEPYLIFSDRTWFTEDTVLRLLGAGPGQIRIEDEEWFESTGSLQQTTNGLYELALLEPGAPASFDHIEPITVDLDLRTADPPDLHGATSHALRPLRIGVAMIHQLDHWSHILRVNQLALVERAEHARLNWERQSWLSKAFTSLKIVWKSRSFRRDRILRALGATGNCTIHPTAVVELCVIGDDVEIGPHAVVRASVIADGARIEEHTTCNFSVMGRGSRLGRYGMLNMSVVYPGAMVSHGGGYQASVFGRDAFVAWGVTALDLSFGHTIPIIEDGQKMDSGQHFLGVAIGHSARLGNGVRLNYGVSIPNDALLVAPVDGLIRDASEAMSGQPARCVDGKATVIKKDL